MIIGLDFDNNIVDYDQVFYDTARARQLIPAHIAANKNAVRDYCNHNGLAEKFTQLQGFIYARAIANARAFDNALDVIKQLHYAEHVIYIISHKTKYPLAGRKYNLHTAARGWIHKNLPFLPASNIFFNETKAEKINKINELQCEFFVDDLPDILLAPAFNPICQKILFCPQNTASDNIHYTIMGNWRELPHFLSCRT